MSNQKADAHNANKRSDGTNQTYNQRMGQRGWDRNPQNPARKAGGKKK